MENICIVAENKYTDKDKALKYYHPQVGDLACWWGELHLILSLEESEYAGFVWITAHSLNMSSRETDIFMDGRKDIPQRADSFLYIIRDGEFLVDNRLKPAKIEIENE